MTTELNDEFKFKLGDQYENWEFELNDLDEFIEDGICYNIYEYLGEKNEVLGICPHKIILEFNADILVGIIYHFQGNHFNHISSCLTELGREDEYLVLLNNSLKVTSIITRKSPLTYLPLG